MSQFVQWSSMYCFNRATSVSLNFFICSFLLGWYSVIVTSLMPRKTRSVAESFETQCRALSVSIVLGIPYEIVQFSSTTVATNNSSVNLGIGMALISLQELSAITNTNRCTSLCPWGVQVYQWPQTAINYLLEIPASASNASKKDNAKNKIHSWLRNCW